MAILVVVHPMLRILFDRVTESLNIAVLSAEQQNVFANLRFKKRVTFDVAFALIFLLVLHGFSAFKVLFILYANFCLATKLPKGLIPPATWIFNIAILFANELCHGYPYSRVSESIIPQPFANGDNPGVNWGTWLDSYGGLVSRWEILFNITILRLISFNLDYYWSLGNQGNSAVEVCRVI